MSEASNKLTISLTPHSAARVASGEFALRATVGARRRSKAMNTLPVIWVLMGLRFMGASPDQEGKWLPNEQIYQTKEACLAAKAENLNGERIHRFYFECIPFGAIKQPPSNPDKYCKEHQEWCTSERDRHPSAED
jgi:hypothetical protein